MLNYTIVIRNGESRQKMYKFAVNGNIAYLDDVIKLKKECDTFNGVHSTYFSPEIKIIIYKNGKVNVDQLGDIREGFLA